MCVPDQAACCCSAGSLCPQSNGLRLSMQRPAGAAASFTLPHFATQPQCHNGLLDTGRLGCKEMANARVNSRSAMCCKDSAHKGGVNSCMWAGSAARICLMQQAVVLAAGCMNNFSCIPYTGEMLVHLHKSTVCEWTCVPATVILLCSATKSSG